VAEYGARAASEHRRPAPAEDAEDAVTDGIDAAMDDVEETVGDPTVDLGLREAEGDELTARDDAALLRGDDGDGAARSELTLHRRV
jgi:hypothetical protein